MAARAGTLKATTVSGKTVLLDLYLPDATGTFLTFNSNGLSGTTSENQHIVAEDMIIEDISVNAAPTAVGASMIVNSGNIPGTAIRWGNQLAANPNRMKLAWGLKAGDQIKLQQF